MYACGAALSDGESDVFAQRFGRMLEPGLLEGKRFEPIDGEPIDKPGQKPPHIYIIRLGHPAGSSGWVIRLGHPAGSSGWYRHGWCRSSGLKGRLVRGDETLLVVEVARTSPRQDTTVKRDLYARAGVPEYWVVSIPDRELIVYRNLSGGRYVRY